MRENMRFGWSRCSVARLALAAVLAVGGVMLGATAAPAATGPVWRVTAISNPTVFTPGEKHALIIVTATNVGGASTDGSAVSVRDVLPAKMTVEEIFGTDAYKEPNSSAVSGDLSCTVSPVPSCADPERVDPGDQIIMKIQVGVESGQPPMSAQNEAVVSGGGAQNASATTQVSIGGAPPSYGYAPGGTMAALSSSQAGARPNVTTEFALSTVSSGNGGLLATPVATPRDIRFDLPPGLVGSGVQIPRCTMAQVLNSSNCPADTMVGTATITIALGEQATVVVPVYNIAPSPGEPVAFAFQAVFFAARLDTSVLTDGNSSVRITAGEITEAAPVLSTSVEIWGVPADHSGPGLDKNLFQAVLGEGSFGGPDASQTRVPLTTNPQHCDETLSGTASTDAWDTPGVFASQAIPMGALTGCEQLAFGSSFSMLPDTLAAGAPAGYSLDLKVPQELGPDGLATPTVKRASVTLPLGTVVSPSAGPGLKACSDAQFFGTGRPRQEPATPAQCPPESKIGSVQIKTPALAEELTGQVYLGVPHCDPCSPQDVAEGRMVRLLMQASTESVVVKLEGKGTINQQTGQITATFEETPPLPFEELKLTTNGGPRAQLANPRSCGQATTTADLTPWSTPFTPDSTPSFSFDVNQGCFAPQFAPSFVAGTTNNQAGAFSPFNLSFARSDSDEFLNAIQIRLPPGLLGLLSSVPLCGESQASAGTCGQESLVGHVQALVGPGSEPFLVEGGQVFLTEGYKGAPFGLSIVVPATAGPYTLAGTTGHGTVVVRAAINVDPTSAAVTITSDPFPETLDGIPLQVREIRATVDRPGFMFNPTNCNRMAVGATLTSTEGASATAGSPFQVTNCAPLHFKPNFQVFTSGHTARAIGASLDAKLTFPSGSEANIAKVKVDLPRQLPSRLTTLQKACPAATFGANPATCPAASVIGIVKARTPLLPVQLSGPAYFVSHGGEAFPNITFVLQGDGVRVDLVGSTFISKKGITSTTLNTVPDVPVGTFELYLPEGKYSALSASGNLCTSKLTMPTSFVAQDGVTIRQNTKVNATGCKTAKTKPKKAKGKAGRSSRNGNGRGK